MVLEIGFLIDMAWVRLTIPNWPCLSLNIILIMTAIKIKYTQKNKLY